VTEVFTTVQAAALLGITRERVWQCIRDKKLVATQVGRQWLIAPEDLRRFIEERGRDKS